MQGPLGEQVPSRLWGMYCPEDLAFATPCQTSETSEYFLFPISSHPVTNLLEPLQGTHL